MLSSRPVNGDIGKLVEQFGHAIEKVARLTTRLRTRKLTPHGTSSRPCP